ncbi:MAG: hypothetical protein R3D00_16995 [Bacteroidia bacterium]
MNRLYAGNLLLLICLFSCRQEENICYEDFPNGTRKYEVACDRWSGDYQGEMRVYNEEGILTATYFFVDDKEEDTTRFYTPDGFVWKKVPMKNGKPEGMLTEYRPDGTLKRTVNFQEGVAEGEYIAYHPDGQQIRESIQYVDGRLSGPYVRYFENGIPEVTGEYMMGFKMGKWTRYRPDGSQLCVFTLYMNLRDGGFGVFKNSGMPYITGEFAQDKIDGELSFFNEDGEIIRKSGWDETWLVKQNVPSGVNEEVNFTASIRIPASENNAAIYIKGDSAWIQP